ncbi:MAG: ABC transporter permease [Nitrososphaerota archaeon]|nr:ABC transporter permease [Nitrososphaerota archaeon]
MRFIFRQIIKSVVAFFVVINLIFFLPRLIPGNAADVLAAGYSGVPQQVVKSIIERLGLGKPLWVQYSIYMQGIFTQWPPYFGISSTFFPYTANYLVWIRLPFTLALMAAAFVLSTIVSYVLAMFSAVRRGGKFEFGSMYLSIIFWALPPFWMGILLIWLFGVILHWLPVGGTSAFTSTSALAYYESVGIHLILPVVTLAAATFGFQYLVLRGTYQEVLKSDFVLAAKARGLRDRLISTGYVMRNSMLPLISLLGYTVSFMLSTAVFVEFVFGYNGIGDLLVDGILQRDYSILEAGFFYVAVLVIIFSVVGDVLLVRLDPRLRGS